MKDPTPTGAWREALDCVDVLLSRTQAERDSYLGELSQSNPDLHRRVRSLLEADREASKVGFLDHGLNSGSGGSGTALRAGAMLGPYRIESELGRGGMGEVWLARRDDGLYQGEVAIKTLHPYFAGGALRDRFLREANLLGRLTHPNIARLLDAGVSDGIVYLVLEYVRGRTIDVWCDDRKLGIDDRLKLFSDVCAAVAHAHANLIVHRDIKPSNILVTDDVAVKLLDFGIGKIVEVDSAPEGTELTKITGRVFTPEYAAPEQILGAAITTATDIYSLGVLLHVLLSGTRPYAGTDNEIELQRAVLKDDPVPMSRAVASLGGEEAAVARSTTSAKLRRRLSGDLSHMVARAMRKAPAERYGSVLAFAADVDRYLRHEPVDARAGSSIYRFERFVTRHRTAAVAASLSLLALLVGSGVALWQAGEARTQARLATVEAGKANAVKDFLLDIFNANSERHPDGARARQTTAEELLDVAGQKILVDKNQDPEVRAELMSTLGNLTVMLDKRDLGESLQRERVKFIAEKFGEDDERLAEALLDLSGVLRQRDKVNEAVAATERAIGILDRTGKNGSVLRGRAELEAAHTLYIGRGGTGDNLIERYAKAVSILERFPSSEDLLIAQLGLGRAYELARKFDDGIAISERALASAGESRIEKKSLIAGGHQQLARMLAEKQRYSDAVAHNAKAVELFSFQFGAKSVTTLTTRTDRGNLLMLNGDYLGAATELEGVVSGLIEIDSDANLNVQTARFLWSKALEAIGDMPRARTVLDAAIQAVGKLQNQNGLPGMLRIRSKVALEQKRAADALADVDRAWEIVQKGRGPRSLRAATLLTARGEALIALGRVDEGQAAIDQSIELLKEFELDPAHPDGMLARLAIAAAHSGRRQHDDARKYAEAVLDELKGLERRKQLWLIEDAAHRQIADALIGAQRPKEACPALTESIGLREASASIVDPRLKRSRELHKKYCIT